MGTQEWPDIVDCLGCGCLVWVNPSNQVDFTSCKTHKDLFSEESLERLMSLTPQELASMVVMVEHECRGAELRYSVLRKLGIDINDILGELP